MQPDSGPLHLHAQAEEEIREALAPYGYYRPAVTPALEKMGAVWQASYEINPGDRTPTKAVDIKVTGGFQVLASQRGYFDAQLKKGEIRIDLKNYEATVTLHFDSGVRYYLGEASQVSYALRGI